MTLTKNSQGGNGKTWKSNFDFPPPLTFELWAKTTRSLKPDGGMHGEPIRAQFEQIKPVLYVFKSQSLNVKTNVTFQFFPVITPPRLPGPRPLSKITFLRLQRWYWDLCTTKWHPSYSHLKLQIWRLNHLFPFCRKIAPSRPPGTASPSKKSALVRFVGST